MFEDTRMRQKLATSYRGELNTTWFVRRLCRDCTCWQLLLFGVNAVADEVNIWPFTMKYWMELIIKMKKLKPSNRLEMSGSSAGVSDHPDPYLLPSWGSGRWDRIIRDHSWELRGTTSYKIRIIFILEEVLDVTKFMLNIVSISSFLLLWELQWFPLKKLVLAHRLLWSTPNLTILLERLQQCHIFVTHYRTVSGSLEIFYTQEDFVGANINHADCKSVSHNHERLQQPFYHSHKIDAPAI